MPEQDPLAATDIELMNTYNGPLGWDPTFNLETFAMTQLENEALVMSMYDDDGHDKIVPITLIRLAMGYTGFVRIQLYCVG